MTRSQVASLGGFARAKALSKARRKQIASIAGRTGRQNMTAKQRRASAMKALLARWKRKKAA
jgi:hypothetical protein